MMKQTFTSQIYIKKSQKEICEQLDWLGCQATNIYNAANYIVRQELFHNNKMLFYKDLNTYFKESQAKHQSNLYKRVSVHFAQQIYRNLDKNWKSWREARKSYERDSSKFLGRPKPPKYKKKNSFSTFYFSNQMFRIVDNKLQFTKPKKDGSFKKKVDKWKKVLTGIKVPKDLGHVLQIRVTKRHNGFCLELIHEKEINISTSKSKYIMSIDPGMNNLATIVSNNQLFQPMIINGKPVKSVNQYYNKKRAKLSSKINSKNVYSTKRLDRLTDKRNHKIKDYFHKASKLIIDNAVSYGISKIVIGSGGTSTKQSINLGKRINQNYVQIPFGMLIQMIQYKAKLVGIDVVVVEESYTSQTSFLDNELPIKENGNKDRQLANLSNRRVKRGLFKSNSGKLINADVNGAYQIMKKVVPNAYVDGIEGLGLNPIKISL